MEKMILDISIIFSILLCAMASVCMALVHREKCEKEKAWREAADAKTEFLSRISYDIKTPMNVIIGMTALGMEEADQPEKVQEYFGRINTAGRFLMGLLGDLVDMSRIETGEFRLHPKSYAFSDFLDEIRLMVGPSCRKKNIAFHMPEEGLNINMMVDPMRLQQLFFNLLMNAVKFTPEGGEVAFKVCNYATHNNCFSADYVVKDNGIGMSREFQQLLFEPFSQERGRQAEKKKGTGLGLAIVRNIVELMGGAIEIKSELGVGTEVRVHLDIEIAVIQPERASEWISEDKSREILRGKRILLVEDHPLDVEVSRQILERQEVKVACAPDGQTALEMFCGEKENFFDLILMDVCMPEMDGLEAAGKIRKSRRADAQSIPIIAMSTDDRLEDIDKCREAGMNASIAKPMEPQKLYQVMCEYLEAPV